MNKRLKIGAGVLLILALAGCSILAPQTEPRNTTVPGQYGSIQIQHGYLQVGDASPDNTLGQGDAYFEDAVEVDGELELDGALDADSTANFAGNVTMDGGVLNIGGGTPAVAAGDNDLYVTGDLEVDGEIEADGAIDADAGVAVAGGSLNVDDAIDQDGSSDEVQLSVTGYTTQTSDLVNFDGGLTDIGGGTYEQVDGDNDLGIAGDLEAEGTTDLAALELAGTAVSASAGELNETAGMIGGATWVVGTEASNDVTATLQLEDADGNDLSGMHVVWVYCSDDSGGDGICGSAPDGGIATGTDGATLDEPEDNKLMMVLSESDGDVDFTLTESGADTFYLVAVLSNGEIVVSDGFTTTAE